MAHIQYTLTIIVRGTDDDPFKRSVSVSLLDMNSPRKRQGFTYVMDTQAATSDARSDLTSWFSDFMDKI